MSARCQGCGADVMWVQMETGGRMLINLPAEKRIVLFKKMHEQVEGQGARLRELGHVLDTYVSHFATCPKADEFRRKHEN